MLNSAQNSSGFEGSVKNKVLNANTGKQVNNKRFAARSDSASWTGLILQKCVTEAWLSDKKTADPNAIITSYADVLLMYAEAKNRDE